MVTDRWQRLHEAGSRPFAAAVVGARVRPENLFINGNS
jgi:hypothetical protein